MRLTPAVLLSLTALVGLCAAEINVKIERHFPCSASSGPSKENLLIKFPSYKSTGVNFREEKNSAGNKCFRMSGGKVEVFPPGLAGSKAYYVHLETRIGIHGKPERCVNADKDGCGGIGSCVHCDICRTMGGNLKNFVQIYQKDAPAKCSVQGLPAGDYDDLSLRVCLPSKSELLPFLDQNASRAQQLWDLFVSSRARSGEIPLVIAARIFNRPINKLNTKELNDALHGSKAGMIGRPKIMRIVAASACVLLVALLGHAAAELAVKIDRHFPCNAKTGPTKENLRIKFPSYKQAGVDFKEERDANGNKCYRMSGGTVKIFAPGLQADKKYFVHVETRIGINGKPEKCINADKDGCGGIGSCVHCDICHSMGGKLKEFVKIFKADKPAQCDAESMSAGDHSDLSLRVCLPNKNDMMSFLDKDPKRAEEMWKFLMNSRGKAGELPLVIAARLYDRPINKLSPAELKDALHGSKDGMIGCHYIYITVRDE
ncbi:hypothetical protein M3Y99_00296300 [Aphelenchoides fujianensis]|nr:hypothetical protein M3Y99_00296300 [Aphelenchoides fujianensis]